MNRPDQLTVLADFWNRLMETCEVRSREARSQAFAQLVAAYSEPQRHYHNLDHIHTMLSNWLLMRFMPKEVELATWYHDVIYDPRRTDNEDRSATVAKEALQALGLAEEVLARVSKLIWMTREHAAPAEDQEALLFLDADLEILSAAPERYAAYAKAIRQEYAWVAVRDFYQGRRHVLQKFLARPEIYRTDHFKFREAAARANITAEIARIDELLRGLPR